MKKASLILAILFAGLSAAFSQIGYEIFEKDQFGLPQKTGSYKPNDYGGYDIYIIDEFGLPKKTGSYRLNDSGGYDFYKIDEFGLPQKQVSVQPMRTW
jgi:hypothetical protein